jgi:hypothetical protein
MSAYNARTQTYARTLTHTCMYAHIFLKNKIMVSIIITYKHAFITISIHAYISKQNNINAKNARKHARAHTYINKQIISNNITMSAHNARTHTLTRTDLHTLTYIHAIIICTFT